MCEAFTELTFQALRQRATQGVGEEEDHSKEMHACQAARYNACVGPYSNFSHSM